LAVEHKPITPMKDHSLIDERSLAFDRLIAEKLRLNPALIGKAEANLQRWLVTCSPSVRPVLLEWQRLLAGSTEALFAQLEATDEPAARLRQSSPFCGVITAAERNRILREFHARESSAA
jgi:hypothetical protein